MFPTQMEMFPIQMETFLNQLETNVDQIMLYVSFTRIGRRCANQESRFAFPIKPVALRWLSFIPIIVSVSDGDNGKQPRLCDIL